MPNRLITQTSPYLLQHAHNPVDWFAWGPEAFAAAREADKPILLSVGYSTCYWCHVMERESFEDHATADLLRSAVIAVKLDREERPDIDELYMVATQLMTGHGGWPMNVFLEPHTLKPFYCGTYYPPEPRHGMPSFRQIIEGIAIAWRDQRSAVLAQADRLCDAVTEHLVRIEAPVPLTASIIETATSHLLRMFDRTHGGFGSAPKFPQPSFVDFLLSVRTSIVEPDTAAAIDHAIRTTLDRIALGGINDHVAGGFHRYAVDGTWTIPHFEKMLYDTAQLACSYVEAARAFDDDFYRRTLRSCLDWALAEMTDAESPGENGFSSALDAEVNAREGLNYLWTPQQFDAVLGSDAALASSLYGLDLGPNFKDPHHPDAEPASVLRLAHRPADLARQRGISERDLLLAMDRINALLRAERSTRPQPACDDKRLVSWNALMIRALALGGSTLGDDRSHAAAIAASRFILAMMRSDDGGLLRTSRDGRAHTPAFLEDHAALIRALCSVHDCSPDADLCGMTPLAAAIDIARRAEALFADRNGAYFDTSSEQTDLFVRPRGRSDGAMPAATSMMLHALLDLHERTGASHFADAALRLAQSLSAILAAHPTSLIHACQAVLRLLRDPALAARLAPASTAPAPPSAAPIVPVQIFADCEECAVAPDQPAVVHIELRIAPGYHVIAADPGPDAASLVPLRVGLASGSGVAVYADYPPGEALSDQHPVRVYRDVVSFAVALEHAPGIGVDAGLPVLAVSFQACSETACLQPMASRLGITITTTPV